MTGKDWNKPMFQMITMIAEMNGFRIFVTEGQIVIEADPEEVEAEYKKQSKTYSESPHTVNYVEEPEAHYGANPKGIYQPKVYTKDNDPTLQKIKQLEEERNKQMLYLADRYGRTKAAMMLNISESTLHRKLAKMKKGQGKSK